DDRDRAVLCIGNPELFAVGRNIESFRTSADGNDSFIPVASGRAHATAWRTTGRLFDDADGSGADVAGDNALKIGRDIDHVRPVLAGAEHPIDFVGGGIVSADDLGGFGGEPGLAVYEGETVRATQ